MLLLLLLLLLLLMMMREIINRLDVVRWLHESEKYTPIYMQITRSNAFTRQDHYHLDCSVTTAMFANPMLSLMFILYRYRTDKRLISSVCCCYTCLLHHCIDRQSYFSSTRLSLVDICNQRDDSWTWSDMRWRKSNTTLVTVLRRYSRLSRSIRRARAIL
jgi:hypothetical protein